MAQIANRQLSRELDGQATDILVQIFADRVLVLVTQFGKVGSLIQASIPETTPLPPPPPAPDTTQPNRQPLPPPPAAIQLTPLLGSAPSEHMQTLFSLYASQIATIVWVQQSTHSLTPSRRSVVVGLALRKSEETEDGGITEREKTVFEGVMSMLYEVLN
ncbi:hypothetical protein Hypma_011672 [Hypsizygus marmoreus]|uniref:Proteasome assembly chaperone 3 n=1 Tax=Hypsizygus marmoreus TaxID=39966 RepID=A0A369JGY3_HYPMA|nr:hypothetical protein Hypma_011672 [Hypsizygus marmoreus]